MKPWIDEARYRGLCDFESIIAAASYFERDIGLCEHADQDIAYFQETRARKIDFCPSRRSIGFCGSPI